MGFQKFFVLELMNNFLMNSRIFLNSHKMLLFMNILIHYFFEFVNFFSKFTNIFWNHGDFWNSRILCDFLNIFKIHENNCEHFWSLWTFFIIHEAFFISWKKLAFAKQFSEIHACFCIHDFFLGLFMQWEQKTYPCCTTLESYQS